MARRIIDLTIPIKHGMRRGLGDPAIFEKRWTFEKHGWQGTWVNLFAHMGTHVDAPQHFVNGTATIDQVPLESVIGEAVLLNLTNKGANDSIGKQDLLKFDKEIRRGDIAVLRTDWIKKYPADEFWASSPYLTKDGADYLVSKKVKAVAFDFAEEYEIRKPNWRGENCPVHITLLGNNVIIVDYVTNLDKLTKKRFMLFALPTLFVGSDAGLARVIAIEE